MDVRRLFSRKIVLSVAAVATAATVVGVVAPAMAQTTTADPGPGRHFIRFTASEGRWIYADVVGWQRGRKDPLFHWQMPDDGQTEIYREWTFNGRDDESLYIHLWNQDNLDSDFTVIPDRNYCFGIVNNDIVQTGDSVTGNCV